MDSQEYWAEIEAIGQAAITDALQNEGDLEDNFADALSQLLDGHNWIIWTRESIDVMQHTDNADALFEVLGEVSTKTWSHTVAQFAFCAMEADVREWFHNNKGWRPKDDIEKLAALAEEGE